MVESVETEENELRCLEQVLDLALAEVGSVRARTSCIDFCRGPEGVLTFICNINLWEFLESRLDGDAL